MRRGTDRSDHTMTDRVSRWPLFESALSVEGLVMEASQRQTGSVVPTLRAPNLDTGRLARSPLTRSTPPSRNRVALGLSPLVLGCPRTW